MSVLQPPLGSSGEVAGIELPQAAVADPTSAFRNLLRAFRPDGMLGFVCWRRLEENELDELPLRAASPHLPPHLIADTASSNWFSLVMTDSAATIPRLARRSREGRYSAQSIDNKAQSVIRII
jgi:hypothetical protein